MSLTSLKRTKQTLFTERVTTLNVLNRKKVTVAVLSLRLGFQKLLDIFDALLRRHGHDVVQSIHVAQHLHNLFQQFPESTRKKTCYPTKRTKQKQLE